MRKAKDGQEWHHAVNASSFRPGSVFAWRDERSETGLLSGIVVEVDHTGMAVLVKDLRAALVR